MNKILEIACHRLREIKTNSNLSEEELRDAHAAIQYYLVENQIEFFKNELFLKELKINEPQAILFEQSG